MATPKIVRPSKAEVLTQRMNSSARAEADDARKKVEPVVAAIDSFAVANALSRALRLGAGGEGGAANESGHEVAGGLDHDAGERRFMTVDISLVDDNPRNSRVLVSQDEVNERAASIAISGQQVPVMAMRNPDVPERYVLIDGHTRKRALLSLGKATIDIDLRPNHSPIELYRQSFLLNNQRKEQTALDNAIAWANLREDGLVSTDNDISALTGLSISEISKTKSMLKMPEAAIAIMREAPQSFPVNVAYELFLLSSVVSDEEELLILMERTIKDKLSQRDLKAERTRIQSRKHRKPKEMSTQYKISVGGEKIGAIKEWPGGRVTLDVKLTHPRERVDLVEHLRQRFQITEEPPPG